MALSPGARGCRCVSGAAWGRHSRGYTLLPRSHLWWCSLGGLHDEAVNVVHCEEGLPGQWGRGLCWLRPRLPPPPPLVVPN